MSADPTVSFEFFPPRDGIGEQKLINEVLPHLELFNPKFVSVTYGAGGSTKEGTFSAIRKLRGQKLDPIPHLSVGNDSDDEIIEVIHSYRKLGVTNILALRGDAPSGYGAGQIKNAAYLVLLIRKEFGDDLGILVAAYPEIHPESETLDIDISFFKEKVEAGADSAITQFFYNPDAYDNFLTVIDKKNIRIPIVPGVMPIQNVDGLLRMSKQCKAEIPRWLEYSLKDQQEDLQKFAIELVTRLCDRLIELGAPGLHFYTLNRWGAVSRICKNLNLQRE